MARTSGTAGIVEIQRIGADAALQRTRPEGCHEEDVDRIVAASTISKAPHPADVCVC